MTNLKVPVTTIFQNARDFSNLPVKILEKMPVKFSALPVTIFDNMPVKMQKVPVTKFKKNRVTGTLGCHGEKKHWISLQKEKKNPKYPAISAKKLQN